MLRILILIFEYFVGEASLCGNFLGGAFPRGILPCGTFPCRAFSCRASLCKTSPSPAERTSAEPSLLDLPCKTFPAEAAFICRAFLCHPSSAEAAPAQPRERRKSVFNSRAQNYQARVRLAPTCHGFPGQRQQFRRQSPDFNSWTQRHHTVF